jgi:hypothetical protein
VLAAALHLEPLHVEDWGIALVGSAVAACQPRMFGRRDLAMAGLSRPTQDRR